MSKKCCNPKIGTLIHAYELGQLTEVETHLFEDHLLDCEFCLDEVSSFQDICQTVLTDHEVHQALKSMVPGSPQSEPAWSRLWKYLWPETNWLLKPVVAYMAVALLVYPAYLGFRNAVSDDAAEPSAVSVRPVQALNLTSGLRRDTRTPSSGTDLVIQFRIRGAEIGKSYAVTLEHEEAGVVFEDTCFTDIDRYDFSSRLYVPAELLKPGEYVLSVKGPGLGEGLAYSFEID